MGPEERKWIVKVTMKDFMADAQGRKYQDVLDDTRISFQVATDFFSDDDRCKRMIESEVHHDRAPLAGVVREFESVPEVESFLSGHDAHSTQRFRQAVGVLVRIIFEDKLQWRKTGSKGSLGSRAKVKAGTITPGAYYNSRGLARWFTRAERYEPPTNSPFYQLWRLNDEANRN